MSWLHRLQEHLTPKPWHWSHTKGHKGLDRWAVSWNLCRVALRSEQPLLRPDLTAQSGSHTPPGSLLEIESGPCSIHPESE